MWFGDRGLQRRPWKELGVLGAGAAALTGHLGAPVQTLHRVRGRVVRWQGASVNRKILASSVLLMALGVVCKFAAAGREVATAYMFGVGDSVDTFVVAFLIPAFAISIFANTIRTAAIPLLSRGYEQGGPDEVQSLLRELTCWTLLLLIGTCLLVATTSWWGVKLLGSGFDATKQVITFELLLILTPAVLFQGLTSLWAAVLQSEERHFASGLVPILPPLLATFTVMQWGGEWGIHTLAVGLVSGYFLQSVMLAWTLSRRGFVLSPIFRAPSQQTRQAFRQFLPLALAAGLMGSLTLVDSAMATCLGPGSVATLNYGHKLVGLAVGIPALSLSQAIFPCFARLVAAGDWQQLKHTLASYSRATLLATIPLTVFLIVLARPIVGFLLQRGAFDASCTDEVTKVHMMYALQVPFFSLGLLYVRLASSLHLNHLLTISTLISIVLNALLNLILTRYLGVAGIALSTSLVYVVSCGFMAATVHRAWNRESSGSWR
jgi:putative peptidoglycan lipid II flippase